MDTRRQMDLPMWKGSQDRKGQIPEPIPGYPLLRCLLVSRRGLVRYGYGSCWASTASVRLPTYQCYNMSSNDGDRYYSWMDVVPLLHGSSGACTGVTVAGGMLLI